LLRLKKEGVTIILSTHNMSSVEELCDNITLINQSKAVLEGNVNELRHRHKLHVWELKFQGTEDSVKNALAGKYELLELSQDNNLTAAKIKIPEGLNSNDLLKTLLPACTVINFSEILPSMSEIFISVVTSTNPSTKKV